MIESRLHLVDAKPSDAGVYACCVGSRSSNASKNNHHHKYKGERRIQIEERLRRNLDADAHRNIKFEFSSERKFNERCSIDFSNDKKIRNINTIQAFITINIQLGKVLLNPLTSYINI